MPGGAAKRLQAGYFGRGIVTLAMAVCVTVLAAGAAGACATSRSGHSGIVTTAAFFRGFGLSGTIGSVGTTSFTLTTRDGTTLTVDTTTSTTVTEMGKQIPASSLVMGERVAVIGQILPNSTTVNASAIVVVLAKIQGQVVSTGSGSFVVRDRQGFSRTVVVSSTTTYSFGPPTFDLTATAADVMVGSYVLASGTVDANHTSLDASSVVIELQRLAGTVSATSGSSFTLSNFRGSVQVTTTPSTVVRTTSGTGSISSIVVGSSVIALGTSSGTASFTANDIFVGRPRPTRPAVSHRGPVRFQGGFGGGDPHHHHHPGGFLAQ